MALQQVVEQTVAGLGFDLVEVERSAGGLLRVTIDVPWQEQAQAEPDAPDASDALEQGAPAAITVGL